MESTRLLECLSADFARLRDVVAGADLTAVVPSCPDWTVADLAQHVGMVYLHKVECMRLGTAPDPWPPAELASAEPLELLDRSYAALMAEFVARTPETPAFTWYGPDQSVGFWIRRMAQETVIHRVDAELGAGVAIAGIPADLAIDGIDEFLVAFIAYGSEEWADDFAEVLTGADGRSVRLHTDGAQWSVTMTKAGIQVSSSDVDDPGAVVSGAPVDLLLWMWNRADGDKVSVTGDEKLVGYLREVLTAGAG
jgi:uncharacterized protein (TIGR03083 family)